VAALGAVIAAIVVVGYVMFGSGGGGYTVTVETQNASQLVPGNLVQVGGTKAGTVKDIRITEDGQAEVEIEVADIYAPLRQGTKAVIRQASQSGIANRYVDLLLPEGTEQNEIDDGGRIALEETTSPVELDELFNTLDPVARVAVQEFFKGGARQFKGRGDQANRGLQYLNPALSRSDKVFTELSKDEPVLEAFLVESAKLVTTLADRKDDLTDLVTNLNTTTKALGNEKVALAEVIRRLPNFFRTANTTFVNLRSTLDDVDPLVDASKPVAPKLARLLADLRPLARDARPTVRDLSAIVRSPGADNDLIELNRTFPALARAALDRRKVNGAVRDGSFPETTRALTDSAPIFAAARPYAPDLLGWFDDFSHTGNYDALGGLSRVQVIANFTSPPGTGGLGNLLGANSNVKRNQFRRCPGAAEEAASDGSNFFAPNERDFDGDGSPDCDELDRATGTRKPGQ